jgi:hypothetical protein
MLILLADACTFLAPCAARDSRRICLTAAVYHAGDQGSSRACTRFRTLLCASGLEKVPHMLVHYLTDLL